MKRIEAVNLIASTLYEFNLDSEDAMEEADKLLTKLEEAGMLPPTVLRSFGENSNIVYFNENEWETEDET